MATDSLTAQKIQGWMILHENLEPELSNLPLIVEEHADLGNVIQEAQRSQREQATLVSSLRQLNQRRRELALAGEEIRLRLAAVLQGKHGFQNEALINFGVKPRQRSRRVRKAPEPPPEPVEATQEQSGKE